ncbi:MAG: DNA primase [Micromonosporaceae bacterium]
MARHRADQPEDDVADDSRADDQVSDNDDHEADADDSERPAAVEKFWKKAQVEPVEIALPRGVGYTLRAYRMSDTLAADEPEDAADELDDEDETDQTETGDAETAKPTSGKAKTSAASKPSSRRRVDEDVDEDDELDDEDDLDDEADDDELDDEDRDSDEDDEEEEEEDDEEDEEPEPEEVPVFLTQDRRLLLFRSPEGLVKFVRSGEQNSMQDLAEWDDLSRAITVDDVVVNDDDRYELDLVVENLRGGQDAWEAELIIKAGELCRDLGHTLRLESVIGALSTGSPLDDLDEALRSVAGGGVGGFFARRKLRRIGAQQAALAWRSIIGKISTSVDWRD